MFVQQLKPLRAPKCRFVLLHGWGTDHTSLLPLANLLQTDAEIYLLDFAGFGKSPPPKKTYSTADYAKDVIDFLKTLEPMPTFLIGHSFGCRVAIRLAQKHKNTVDGLVLIAGAGLKYRRSLWFKIYAWLMKYAAKIVKRIPLVKDYIILGSSDYKKATGIMRAIFVKTVNENLENSAKDVKLPTLLIYGTKDRETPVYFGQIYHSLMPKSELFVLSDADHFSLIFKYKHQVQNLIYKFVEKVL